MALPLYRATQRLNERISDLKEQISAGNLPTWDLYLKKTHVLQGLREALDIIKEAEENYLNEDD